MTVLEEMIFAIDYFLASKDLTRENEMVFLKIKDLFECKLDAEKGQIIDAFAAGCLNNIGSTGVGTFENEDAIEYYNDISSNSI